METIVPEVELHKAIAQLEIKQKKELQALKSHFHETYESLKPVNLVKSLAVDVFASPEIKDGLVNSSIGLAAGFLAKKVVSRSDSSPAVKLIGTVIELGVANLVTKNPDGIKNIATILVNAAVRAFATTTNLAAEKKKLMKEIMELTVKIQNQYPELYKLLCETPMPLDNSATGISLKSLLDYRNTLKEQLEQFNSKES